MKYLISAVALMGTLLGALPATSAERTVTLSVDMWCPTCPYIVSRVLEATDGVLAVDVSYDDQVAVVRFDDERTDVAALTEATAEVGFPSQPVAVN